MTGRVSVRALLSEVERLVGSPDVEKPVPTQGSQRTYAPTAYVMTTSVSREALRIARDDDVRHLSNSVGLEGTTASRLPSIHPLREGLRGQAGSIVRSALDCAHTGLMDGQGTSVLLRRRTLCQSTM